MGKARAILIVLGCVLVAGIQAYIPQKRLKDSIVFSFNEQVVTYPVEFLKLTSFGYSRAFSSLLWLRFLQQTPPQKVEKNQLSWIYYDLNSVIDLDPGFYPAYEHGGIFLSVITEDKIGAERILSRGVKAFPSRWRPRVYLAYHYQFELDEPEKAKDLYIEAAHLPEAPAIVKVLAGSAVAQRQGNASAIGMLKALLRGTQDPAARARIEEKIRKLEKPHG